MDELCSKLHFSLPERTMQRRLKGLEENGKITSTGRGKGKRYLPAITQVPRAKPTFVPIPSTLREEPPIYETIPLSSPAREIRDLVRSPLISRTPVGYDSDFLASYVPNETMYLNQETRTELARIGQVGVSDLPAGTYIREVLDRLLIDLSWNSSRLEGNTYSLLETELLLARGEGADGRNVEETQMILNHKAAIEMLAEQAGEIGFNRYTICNVHALLSDNLLQDPSACGRLRSRPVGIGGTVFHPLEVPQKIEACFLEILAKAEAITDPFEQAFFAMVHLPYLQPFEDVNKRVSRLAANIPLVKYNLCPLSFIDVPQDDYISGLIGIYELNRIDLLRDVFIWAYKRSASRYSAVLQSLGDPDPFRLRYRTQIGEAVREVVKSFMKKGSAAQWIAEQASEKIRQEDRHRFTEVVETELMSLHEGNIARYRLRPAEFSQWKAVWR
ncbi:MAG: Fic family protein [Luteolibacter sp.]